MSISPITGDVDFDAGCVCQIIYLFIFFTVFLINCKYPGRRYLIYKNSVTLHNLSH